MFRIHNLSKLDLDCSTPVTILLVLMFSCVSQLDPFQSLQTQPAFACEDIVSCRGLRSCAVSTLEVCCRTSTRAIRMWWRNPFIGTLKTPSHSLAINCLKWIIRFTLLCRSKASTTLFCYFKWTDESISFKFSSIKRQQGGTRTNWNNTSRWAYWPHPGRHHSGKIEIGKVVTTGVIEYNCHLSENWHACLTWRRPEIFRRCYTLFPTRCLTKMEYYIWTKLRVYVQNIYS